MATVFSLTIQDLPTGWSPFEAVTVLRCLDEEGRETAAMRCTDGLQPWEVVGLLRIAEHQTLLDAEWEDED